VSSVLVPHSGVIRKAFIHLSSTGVAGSNENISFSTRKNATSTDLITATNPLGASTADSEITGLAIAVDEGDRLEIKMDCPVWATNPTNVRPVVTLWVE